MRNPSQDAKMKTPTKNSIIFSIECKDGLEKKKRKHNVTDCIRYSVVGLFSSKFPIESEEIGEMSHESRR